ncbi:unnamed protein product [Owenia fusiformis]|uniref:Uncharacterized protein n=1 Tax=Owenia fusiformis TaxID=6347 RepID=A0A8J1XJ41_OWEFU|nr:unnamed protein product [Owenia fusiformis]
MNSTSGRMGDQGFPTLDLSGKLIIKAQLGNDIRRIPIHNEDITYDELILMMQRVFRGHLDSSDEVTIKYKDDEGDLISIFDSSDLSFAIQCSRILRLTIFVNDIPKPLEDDEIKHMKSELQDIRDRVNHLLDRLEPQPRISSASVVEEQTNNQVPDSTTRNDPSPAPTSVYKPATALESKEFDPLSKQKSQEENATQNAVLSSFGHQAAEASDSAGLRPGTPDSVSSHGSATPIHQRQPPAQAPPQQQQQQYPQGYGQQQQGAQQSSYPQATQASSASQQPKATPQQPGYFPPQASQSYPSATASSQSYSGASQPSTNPSYTATSQYGQQQQQQQQYQQQPQQYAGQQSAYNQQQQYGGQAQAAYPAPQGAAQPAPSQPQPGGANPYSRGPSYGQYPRPAGNYPTPPGAQGYQQ